MVLNRLLVLPCHGATQPARLVGRTSRLKACIDAQRRYHWRTVVFGRQNYGSKAVKGRDIEGLSASSLSPLKGLKNGGTRVAPRGQHGLSGYNGAMSGGYGTDL
jgi:hypothetical protein